MYKQGIIDMSYLAYKALFRGQETGFFIYDYFINTTIINSCIGDIIKILRMHPEIDKWFLSYDSKPKQRTDLNSEYKKNRSALNLERKNAINFYDQLRNLKNILCYSKLYQCEKEGYESDDVICTLASKESSFIVANDKDLYVLLDNSVITNLYETKDRTWFIQKYGIAPKYWTIVQALMGDQVDGVKGIKGIGIKKAIKLVNELKEKALEFVPEIDYNLVLLRNDLELDFIEPLANYYALFNALIAFQLFDHLIDIRYLV